VQAQAEEAARSAAEEVVTANKRVTQLDAQLKAKDKEIEKLTKLVSHM
jgi:hypothetical protein